MYFGLSRLLLIIVTLLTLVMSPLTSAVAVNGLYQASIEVGSQDEKDRMSGFDLALRQVLVRVSGSEELFALEQIKKEIKKSERFVQKFSYQENPAYKEYQNQLQTMQLQQPAVAADNSSLGAGVTKDSMLDKATTLVTPGSDVEGAEEVDVPEPYLLNVSFSPLGINRLLQHNVVPLWGRNRPLMLFWVGLEVAGERELVGSTSASVWLSSLQKEAKKRGVPVFFPVADLDDLSQLDMGEFWGLYSDAIAAVSEKYSRDGDVMVKIFQTSEGRWSAQWIIQLKQDQLSGEIFNASQSDVVRALVDACARYLASQYAVVQGAVMADNEAELEISGVNAYQDYVELSKYLDALAPVESSQVIWMSGDRVRYRLKLTGFDARLDQYLDLDARLIPEEAPIPDADESKLAGAGILNLNDEAVQADALGPVYDSGQNAGEKEQQKPDILTQKTGNYAIASPTPDAVNFRNYYRWQSLP